MPSPRTYHASCSIGKYMVSIGGEANADLRDFWALDLDANLWLKPEIDFVDYYTPKRFHTINTISDTQIVTFGGCHSEYVHMNEMHIFNLQKFLESPQDPEAHIIVTKVNVTQGMPSTRWGHAATTYEGKLYIFGGRNEQDVIDLHEFDPIAVQWREIEISDPKPKPRRRHSALFISGSLVMFGGFDGNFYNDLNILDFQAPKKQIINIQPSSINADYRSLVNQRESADIVFVLDTPTQSKIYAHKALILFRLVQREFAMETAQVVAIKDLFAQREPPEFIKHVYLAPSGQEIFLKDVSCRDSFLLFLEFLYCDKFLEKMTNANVKKVAAICNVLNLAQTHYILKKKTEFAKMHIQQKYFQIIRTNSTQQENS